MEPQWFFQFPNPDHALDQGFSGIVHFRVVHMGSTWTRVRVLSPPGKTSCTADVERKWKLWVDLTGLNQTSSHRTDEIGWNIKKTRLILRETLIRCDFTLKLYKAIFNIQYRKKKWQTQCDFFFVHSHITKSSSATNLNVNLEPGVLNELIGEPLSTTKEHHSIFDIYSISLLNSKMRHDGNF